MFNSLKTFWILIIFLVILFFIEFSIDYFLSNKNRLSKKSDIEQNEIQNIFLQSLNNFDISNKLIQKVSDKNYLYYNVNVYSDVAIDLILLELERNFSDKNVTIISKDSIQNSLTSCRIYSNDKIKLVANFLVDKNITRNKGKLSFLIKISDLDDLSNEIIESPEPISFLIIPQKSFQRNIRLIKESNKRYYIFINNEIEDLIYKFGKNYSRLQTKNIIYNILRDFDYYKIIFIDLVNFWLDDNTLEIIRYELKRNNISLYDTSSMIDLTNDDEKLAEKIFADISKMSASEKKIYIITPNQYQKLSGIFSSFRKTGYKIVNVNELL